MKEKPILFKGEMIRAILAGNKTQTRRIVKPQPSSEFDPSEGVRLYHPTKVDARTGEAYPGEEIFGAADESENFRFPFGNIGDRLWVKETHSRLHDGLLQHLDPEPDNGEQWNNGWSTVYRADGEPANWKHYGVNWKPSIFCTRKFSRITLEIVSVRVERLNDISEADAIAEGIEKSTSFPTHWKCYSQQKVSNSGGEYVAFNDPRNAYKSLWESINGANSWSKKTWVWRIEFKKL